MLNKLAAFIRQQKLISAGDEVVCAVSGGADSVALLFGLYLLKEKLGIRLSAAHFNHNLRGEESDGDEDFVRNFCRRYDIELFVGSGQVTAGKKGLEAAAREARYGFFEGLSGKIATAHTADDNAETVLLHLIRGTGLKGLGAIAPQRGRIIRPMLSITRQEVLAFLEEYHLAFREDSSNAADQFLRNRLRHHVMPLLKQENPRLAENLSAMALRLRQDEEALSSLSGTEPEVEALRAMPPALRSRALERFLKENGVKEPEAAHIAQTEALVFSEKPSAFARFPGGVRVCRRYGLLTVEREEALPETVQLSCPGRAVFGEYTVICEPAAELENSTAVFTVDSDGPLTVRARRTGDAIRLSGGTKTLKKLFIDRKIPAAERAKIPVITDDRGILAVYGIGADGNRMAKKLPAVQIKVEK